MLEFAMVDGIAKDGAKSGLCYFSNALGCNFYRRLNFAFCPNAKPDGTE
jgi:hypothetical protein